MVEMKRENNNDVEIPIYIYIVLLYISISYMGIVRLSIRNVTIPCLLSTVLKQFSWHNTASLSKLALSRCSAAASSQAVARLHWHCLDCYKHGCSHHYFHTQCHHLHYHHFSPVDVYALLFPLQSNKNRFIPTNLLLFCTAGLNPFSVRTAFTLASDSSTPWMRHIWSHM